MAAWKLKENRPAETGRAITLEYGERELVVHVLEGQNTDVVVAEYGQRLVEIVEGEKKAATFTALPAEVATEADSNPKKPCGCAGKKTLGIISLGKAILGGAASPEIAAQRFAICHACQATDPTGTLLYRVIDGKAYCGVPRLSDIAKIHRDETQWGCGCELAWKAGLAETGCPIGRW